MKERELGFVRYEYDIGVLCSVIYLLDPFLLSFDRNRNLFVRLLLLLLVRVDVSVHVFAVEEFLHLRNLSLRIEPHQVHEIVVQIFAWRGEPCTV